MNKKIYGGLAAAAAIVLAASWWLSGNNWASGLGLNLGAGIVGILITLIFVERIVNAREEENRRRVARGALRKTGESLQRIVRAFSNLLKGSLEAIPFPPPKTITELFSDRLVESLSRCNLGLQTAPTARGWAEYANNVLYNSLAGISAAIDMYGTVLQAEYVELLDELQDHVYIEYVRSMFPYIEHERTRDAEKEFPLDGRPEDRKNFFQTLCRAVELHNRIAEKAIEVPSSFAMEGYAPEVGSLRIAAARKKSDPPPERIPPPEPGSSGRPQAPPALRIEIFDP